MEILLHRKHQSLILRYALNLVSPLPRNLNGRLDSLRACVHGQNHIESKHARRELGEAGEDIVVEGATAERQS
jgi:hypothetical protein